MNRNNRGRGVKIVIGDMPINTAMRKFKQRVEESGLLETVKDNLFFEKPTTERKRKKGAARARWLKKLRDKELPKKLF